MREFPLRVTFYALQKNPNPMLAISRKTEYGIIALKYMMLRGTGTLCTAKEIATRFKISEQLMAKILQKLAKNGLIASTQGVRGGYTLAMRPSQITVARIVEAIDGPFGIVDCVVSGNECNCIQYQEDVCNIMDTFAGIQTQFKNLLEGIALSDFNKSNRNRTQLINVSV